jgi:sRNA-binding carbon storage regulator CsrA
MENTIKKGLVLTRKVGEIVRLTLEDGRIIDVELGRIEGNNGQARIRFTADKTIDIKRLEIWEAPCAK